MRPCTGSVHSRYLQPPGTDFTDLTDNGRICPSRGDASMQRRKSFFLTLPSRRSSARSSSVYRAVIREIRPIRSPRLSSGDWHLFGVPNSVDFGLARIGRDGRIVPSRVDASMQRKEPRCAAAEAPFLAERSKQYPAVSEQSGNAEISAVPSKRDLAGSARARRLFHFVRQRIDACRSDRRAAGGRRHRVRFRDSRDSVIRAGVGS